MSSLPEQDEFSTHAVPTDARVASFRVAAVASVVSFSLPTLIAGIEVSSGVGPDLTLAAILGGALVIFLIGWLMGSIGARTGFNSYLLVRLAFGDVGARIVNVMFSISLLGWFGINLNLFGLALAGLSEELFGVIPPELLVTIMASLLITLTTIIGFRAINLVSTLMIPVLAFVALALLVTATNQTAPLVARSGAEISLGDGISAIVGSIVIGSIIMPDITRFLRTSGGALLTSGTSFMIAQPLVMWVAASAAMVLGAEDIISIMLTLGLGLGAFIIIIAGSWVLNALNLYSAVLAVTASFPSLSARTVTVVLGVTGVTAGLLNILDSFVTFLFYLSVIFIPVAGVIIVDHFIARPQAYRVTEVEENQPINRWGLLAWLMGAAVALAASEGFIGSLTRVAALDAMLTAAVLYWIAARLGWTRQ